MIITRTLGRTKQNPKKKAPHILKMRDAKKKKKKPCVMDKQQAAPKEKANHPPHSFKMNILYSIIHLNF